jgi:predicted nucleic acid-binding protein
MTKKKSDKIILADADVISHFITAGEIIFLPKIFPYKIKVLDKVYAELKKFPHREREVANLINHRLIEELKFPDENAEIKREYSWIKSKMFKGDGESACLAVARYQKNILASSNLKDIISYCTMHQIPFLTTMDFLCEALRKGIFTEERCNDFIKNVLAAKSKLPVSKMKDYTCVEKAL